MGLFGKKTTAHMKGQALTLFIPDAHGGRLWRASLDHFHTATLELHDKPNGVALALVSPRGTEDIAVFDKHKDAEQALCAIAGALGHKGGWGRRLFKLAVFLLALLGLMTLFSGTPQQAPGMSDNAKTPSATRAPVKPGVPVPAEELFGR